MQSHQVGLNWNMKLKDSIPPTIIPMLATMTPLPANMRRAAAKGFINATDCTAGWLLLCRSCSGAGECGTW